MRTYTDIDGVEHCLAITLATRRDLKAQIGVDLLEAATQPAVLTELLTKLAGDPEYLLRALACIEGVPAESLEAVFDGGTTDDAATALVEAIIDFFPKSSPVRRPLLALMEKAKSYRDLLSHQIEDQLTEAAGQVDLDTVFSESDPLTSGSGESPASADSIDLTTLPY